MDDDPSQLGPAKRLRIDLREEHEVHYWMRKFGATRGQLIAIVDKVGSSIQAIEGELRAQRGGRSFAAQ